MDAVIPVKECAEHQVQDSHPKDKKSSPMKKSNENWKEGRMEGRMEGHEKRRSYRISRSPSPRKRYSSLSSSKRRSHTEKAMSKNRYSSRHRSRSPKFHHSNKKDNLSHSDASSTNDTKPSTVCKDEAVTKQPQVTSLYAKQCQASANKKKLLWSKSASKSWNNWESASFEGDDSGETQSKFRRLMGIKEIPSQSKAFTSESSKLLQDLESQYESSRFMTHLAKGAGLGYGTSAQIRQTKVDPTETDDFL